MGRLIVIDGLDGSGKATQTAMLLDTLRAHGHPARGLSFPDYDSPSSSLVKMYLAGAFGEHPEDVNAYAASAFYAVDRIAGYLRDWRRDYEGGVLLVADRYVTSNAIHQMAKLPSERWEEYLTWLDDFEYGRLGLPRPDRVFWLDMPPEISRALLLERAGGVLTDLHERDLAYLARCRQAAGYVARKQGWISIPCGGDGKPLPADDIHHTLWTALCKEIGFDD